jgi:Arc/MetJ-type ribon-helix-helix transcriptional regulator
MIRTQIQLPDGEYQQLREVAARSRRSMADCIREGIRLFLRRCQAEEKGLDEIAGAFKPLPLDELKPHDRWLAEGAVGPTTGDEE